MSELPVSSVRSVLARYLGNGVRFGDTGFRIQGLGLSNDFQIDAGTLLVQGIELRTAQTRYSQQPGVPPLATALGETSLDLVYLDVSFIEVTGAMDPNLLNKGDVGIQTSVRQKAVWVVRVAQDGVVIPPAVSPGHIHVPLAHVMRRVGVAQIQPEHVVRDLREQISVGALAARIQALEEIHAPTIHAPPNEFSPKTLAAGPGGSLTVFGRNYDLIRTNLRVTLFSDVTLRRFELPVTSKTATQAIATIPPNVVPAGAYFVIVSNQFGSTTSRERLNITA
jgi:hypothetical protein